MLRVYYATGLGPSQLTCDAYIDLEPLDCDICNVIRDFPVNLYVDLDLDLDVLSTLDHENQHNS